MPKSKSLINLLPQEEFEASLLGRFLKWAMGTFRIIVIITEMIVMGAFLSRFWLDAQNSDLADSLKIKSAQISSQSDFEKNFRNVQNKLSIIKAVSAAAPPSSKVDTVSSKIPPEVTLTSVSVSENSALIKGTSLSEMGIAQFMSNLKAEQNFKKVDLTSANTSEENEGVTIFSLKISY